MIRINKLTTIEEITKYTTGAFCKSCIKPGGHEKKDIYLEDILNEYLNENKKINDNNFKNLTLVQKIKVIDKIIEEDIRHMLMMDGGDV